MIHVWLNEREHFTILYLEPSRNEPDPKDLRTMELPDINGTKGLVVALQQSRTHKWSGWVSGYPLLHYRNRCQWIAVYDAQRHTGVIIASFGSKYIVGDEVEVQLYDRFTGEPVRLGASLPYKTSNLSKAPHRQGFKKAQKK